jgi:hypothetical protein
VHLRLQDLDEVVGGLHETKVVVSNLREGILKKICHECKKFFSM